MERTTYALKRISAIVFNIALGMGCAPIQSQSTFANRRPNPQQEPDVVRATRKGPLVAEAAIVGDLVSVSVTREFLCRSTTSTPAVVDVRTINTLSKEGKALQVALASSAVALAGLGTYLAAANCEQVNGAPCEQRQEDTYKIAGGLLVTAGIGSAVMFGVNAARAQDGDLRTIAAPPHIATTEWKTCSLEPARDQAVKLRIGADELRATTDAWGKTSFDLSQVQPRHDVILDPNAYLSAGGRPIKIALHGLTIYPIWHKQTLDYRAGLAALAAQRAEQARIEKEKQEQAAMIFMLKLIEAGMAEQEAKAMYKTCLHSCLQSSVSATWEACHARCTQ